MKILVLGATGKTGRILVKQLIDRGHKLRLIVRATQKLPTHVLENLSATLIEASVLNLTDLEMAEHARGCDAVVSCLGHVLDFKGLFGEPKKLCTDATRRFCDAIEKNVNYR